MGGTRLSRNAQPILRRFEREIAANCKPGIELRTHTNRADAGAERCSHFSSWAAVSQSPFWQSVHNVFRETIFLVSSWLFDIYGRPSTIFPANLSPTPGNAANSAREAELISSGFDLAARVLGPGEEDFVCARAIPTVVHISRMEQNASPIVVNRSRGFIKDCLLSVGECRELCPSSLRQ